MKRVTNLSIQITVCLFLIFFSYASFAVEMTEAEFIESLPPDVASAKLVKRLSEGDQIPDFHLPALGNGSAVTKADLEGKPSVLIFFAVDNPAREKRSLKLLEQGQELSKDFGSKLRIWGICSDRTGASRALDLARESSIELTLLDDSDRAAYALFGIFVMPVALITAPDGTLLAKVPYSTGVDDKLRGWVRVALGDITRAELEKQLEPVHEEDKTPEEKEFIRRLSLARLMVRRNMYPKAVIEFSEAARLMPGETTPLLEMGFVQIRMKEWASAEATFDKILEKDPEHLDAVAGLGLALHGQGKDTDALPELQDASITVKPRPEVLVALAEIYTKQGKDKLALSMYKKAVERFVHELEDCRAATIAGGEE